MRTTRVIFLGALLGLTALPLSSQSTSLPYQVVHGWPKLPEGFALGQVSGVGVDSHDHVFVFHRGEHPVLSFEGTTGKLIAAWGDDLFAVPHGLTVDSHDNIWLTDVGHHQVFKFSHDGQLLMTVGARDVPGVDGNHFNKPTHVAVTADGAFYISDGYGNNRVVKFSPDGKFLFDWGRKGDQPGEFNLPHSIALDSQGRVYIADRSNARLEVFDAVGKFLYQWKDPAIGRPWDVAIGADGTVYVMDGGDLNPQPPDRGRVVMLSPDGKVLGQFGSFGKYDGQFYWGHAVAVAKNGEVYVGDVSVGMRVQKFVKKQ